MSEVTNNQTINFFWLTIYRTVFSLVIIFGVVINKKLFNTVRNETPGERGKVFQQILKSYAVIQFIGWPFIWVWLLGIGILLQTDVQTIPACFYVNCVHIGVFSYLFVRTYVGFTSLILAAGRYIFVVHDHHVMKWGIEVVARTLIRSSFIIPMLMALLSDSVITLEYNGWLSQIQPYEASCNSQYSYKLVPQQSIVGNRTAKELFKSPLYDALHSLLPTWSTSVLYWLYIALAVVLFSNISEGVIYSKCALFVFRYLKPICIQILLKELCLIASYCNFTETDHYNLNN